MKCFPLWFSVLLLEIPAVTLLACSGDHPTPSHKAAADTSSALEMQATTVAGAPSARPEAVSALDALGGLTGLCTQVSNGAESAPAGCLDCVCATVAQCGAPCAAMVTCMVEQCADKLADRMQLRKCSANRCDAQVRSASKKNLPGVSVLNRCLASCGPSDAQAVDSAAAPTPGE